MMRAIANKEQISRIVAAITDDACSAFAQLLTNIGDESPYGFALYTDDSATGLDAAVNTRESYSRKVVAHPADSFAAYWYPIEFTEL